MKRHIGPPDKLVNKAADSKPVLRVGSLALFIYCKLANSTDWEIDALKSYMK